MKGLKRDFFLVKLGLGELVIRELVISGLEYIGDDITNYQ
jgi:hypothetical protein